MNRALVIVDPLKDFTPGGSLAVPDGHSIMKDINFLAADRDCYDLVVAIKEQHPAGHISFASSHNVEPFTQVSVNGRLEMVWPDHCVAGTPGGEFHDDLKPELFDIVVIKGANPLVDSYSGFMENDGKTSTGLADVLKEHDITDVDVCGLATDWCVKATAIHSIEAGFRTRLLADASRAVNLNPGDEGMALKDVWFAGGEIVESPGLAAKGQTTSPVSKGLEGR